MQGHAFGRYGRGFQGHHFLAHLNIQAAVFIHLHFQAHVFHGVTAEIQMVISSRDLHAPKTVTVCHGVGHGLVVIHRNAHHGLGRGLVPDITVDDGLPALSQVLFVTYLIHFVQIGGGYVLFQAGRFSLLGTRHFEPVRTQGRMEGVAVDNIQAALPFGNRITGRDEFVQGLVQELAAGSLQAIRSGVFLGFGNEEAVSGHQPHYLHQGIGRNHPDAHRVVLGVARQGQQHPKKKEDTNAFHGLERLGWHF